MKKGETYTGRVQHVDFPNKAVVFTESENPEDNGQKVIVKNSIPGQKVRFMVNKKRGGKCEGRLLQVLENARQKRQTDVSISEHAAAVSTRVCSMKNS